ncbi:hematopoietic prostaglandin D synthase isoform X2 [Microcaecilia unicolor]|uniref:glutathione transferase n=1 Tax=Microcaecilia unicolor TaxID=1415580 RepID=A0A6P7WTR0_9AMPH|nr:hematopoietic prostaglandin D synthase isoform X2 [Microcaecilia unicolor]
MPYYKLTYFNLRGRAEIARYIFAFSGIKYEDNRIGRMDWLTIKPSIPFGKLPFLEVDGIILHQSLAIGRYLAKETGLAGKTHLEQAQVDGIVDSIDDFISLFPWGEQDQDVKQEIQNNLFSNLAPELLQHLENYLGEKDWFVGNSVTWADFYWDVCSTTLIVLNPNFAQNFSKLLALKNRVQTLPATGGNQSVLMRFLN